MQTPALGWAHVTHPGNTSLSPPNLGKSIFLPLSKHALDSPALVPWLIPKPGLASPVLPTQPAAASRPARVPTVSPPPQSMSVPPGLCPVRLFTRVCAYTQSCRQRAGRIETVSQCRLLSTYYVLGTAVSTPLGCVMDALQNPREVCVIVPNLQKKKLGLRGTQPGNGVFGSWAQCNLTSPTAQHRVVTR